jgi:hypothetical protein
VDQRVAWRAVAFAVEVDMAINVDEATAVAAR